jgi:hypothetical protein
MLIRLSLGEVTLPVVELSAQRGSRLGIEAVGRELLVAVAL